MYSFIKSVTDSETGFKLHRPLAGWSFAIIIGTAIGFHWGGSLLWLVAATVAMVWAWGTRRVLPLLFACLALVAWRAALLHERNVVVLNRLETLRGETFELKVTVANDCHIVQRKRGGAYCSFSVDRATFPDGMEVHGTNLLVNFYDKSGEFPCIGETWKVQGKLLHLRSLYRMTLSVRGETAERLPDESRVNYPQYFLSQFRNRLAENLARGVTPSEALLTQTMTLGTRKKLPYTARKLYADTGIIHIFAISGLHVGIVAGILVWILAWSGVLIRTRWLILFPALFSYLLLTGIPPSATRACVMAVIYCFAPSVLRRSDACSAFFVTAAAVLLISPGWIANVGALLSFSVMGGILLLIGPLSYFLNCLFRSKVQRNVVGELPRHQPWHLKLRHGIALILALTISAWIASLPFSLYFFGRISIAGLVLNLFVPTVTIAIVWCACVSAFAGFVLPVVSVILNRLNAFFLECITWAAEGLHTMPWSLVELNEPIGCLLTLLLEASMILIGLWLKGVESRMRFNDLHDPQNYRFFI
ncbi:MAG: ComEC/Rec2 family competence protein [Kiritimatiellia bacterium]